MNMPVIMSAEKRGVPSSVIDMRMSSRSGLAGRLGGPSCGRGSPVHDLLHQLDQRDAGGVTGTEAGDVGVGVDVGQGVGAPLQVVVQLGESAVELLAKPSPDQARRRRVDRQFGEPVEQVDLATVAPAGDHLVHLALDRLGVAAHVGVTQRLVAQHLPSPLGGRIEHDALAKDRRHERVGGGLVEVLVLGPEEDLVGLRTAEQHDLLVGQRELADVAALVAHPLHQSNRVAPQLPRGGRWARPRLTPGVARPVQ
nr:hypothetical protein [Candidatus Microthrix sp.]